jgi:hypothetical protein
MSRSRVVTIGWEHEEQDFRVICNVTPGTPDRGPDMSCAGGYPGDPPEVEVLKVIEDRPGGKERPELVEVVEREFAHLEERALEAAAEDEPPYDTLEEARGDR